MAYERVAGAKKRHVHAAAGVAHSRFSSGSGGAMLRRVGERRQRDALGACFPAHAFVRFSGLQAWQRNSFYTRG